MYSPILHELPEPGNDDIVAEWEEWEKERKKKRKEREEREKKIIIYEHQKAKKKAREMITDYNERLAASNFYGEGCTTPHKKAVREGRLVSKDSNVYKDLFNEYSSKPKTNYLTVHPNTPMTGRFPFTAEELYNKDELPPDLKAEAEYILNQGRPRKAVIKDTRKTDNAKSKKTRKKKKKIKSKNKGRGFIYNIGARVNVTINWKRRLAMNHINNFPGVAQNWERDTQNLPKEAFELGRIVKRGHRDFRIDVNGNKEWIGAGHVYQIEFDSYNYEGDGNWFPTDAISPSWEEQEVDIISETSDESSDDEETRAPIPIAVKNDVEIKPSRSRCNILGGRKTRRKKKYNKRTRKKGGGKKPKKVYDIIKIFKQYPKIFPSGYFRFLPAVLDKHIKDKTLIYKNGVVLTYTKYKKRPNKYAKYGIEGGDVKIHQFLNKNQGNGKAKPMFKKFIKKHKKSNFVLEVMKNNRRAIKFYNKNGFRKVGNTKFGKLSGIIMIKKKK
jgi:hypothetical protein